MMILSSSVPNVAKKTTSALATRKNTLKGAREKIRLVSTAETGHFYTTDKNKRNMPEKMEIKKYCPRCNKMTVHKEKK